MKAKTEVFYSPDAIIEIINDYEILETYEDILEIYELKNYRGLDLIVSKSHIYLVHNYGGVLLNPKFYAQNDIL
jgi:hypothetical protein